MGAQKPEQEKKHICAGLLAHVDAGKTTLSEGLLYTSGEIRKLGRVDNRDAFLDNHELEKARGITIFSKQAHFQAGDWEITLLDTPGHVDFSPEMERTLQVLDYGILVISGSDGVQGHTRTLWRLLENYRIPVFLFINKMDQPGTDKAFLLSQLKQKLDGNCIDFNQGEEELLEDLATCEEAAMEKYLEQGTLGREDITRMVAARKVFPCYFGSALYLDGVEALFHGLGQYAAPPDYPEEFGARVFKIARDSQGNRLTYLKVTGGTLKTREVLSNASSAVPGGGDGVWEEKVTQIRVYSGNRYETIPQAKAGMVCAVAGLAHTFPGQGLGAEPGIQKPILRPALNYQIQLPPSCDVHQMLENLRRLEEEEPQLHISWNERLQEIHAQVMGEIQMEVLQSLIQERFQTWVEFGARNVIYKETILEPTEGVGHFEPLRHYAEVHLLLEPGEPGSGLAFSTAASEDDLDRNWQRLVLTHLKEREHPGVLTGSPITDMKITLVAGRAHLKHTEGGDFREATCRAVRQGLKKAKSILLEPWYAFRLEVPEENIGRAMSDIQLMGGDFQPPQAEVAGMGILSGNIPAASVGGYQAQVASYSRGRGQFYYTWKGYAPCHNQEEVIQSFGYDSEKDLDNPTGSVFCSHGAGQVVSWDQVENHMDIDTGLAQKLRGEPKARKGEPAPKPSGPMPEGRQLDKELEEIFQRTYGTIRKGLPARERRGRTATMPAKGAGKGREPRKRESLGACRLQEDQQSQGPGRPPEKGKSQESGSSVTGGDEQPGEEDYLLVDGYNVIFAWDGLKELAEADLGAARDTLMDILSDYQGLRGGILILVFDAYKVPGGNREMLQYHNIYVVFTKEAETADQYIEKTAHRIAGSCQVTVATSDALEQIIIRGQGCRLLSARELREEIQLMRSQARKEYLGRNQEKGGKNYLFSHLDQDMAASMEEIRLGKAEGEKRGNRRERK